jgi:hypothetical protein
MPACIQDESWRYIRRKLNGLRCGRWLTGDNPAVQRSERRLDNIVMLRGRVIIYFFDPSLYCNNAILAFRFGSYSIVETFAEIEDFR